MRRNHIFSSILMTVCLWTGSLLPLQAAGQVPVQWPQGPDILGDYAVVMEVSSGTVLYEKNAHTQQYPASTTKILTGLLAIENSELEEEVIFSYDAVHQTEGSSIWRDVDEVMTMEQCLYALMLNSANECAYAVAEHVGGDYQSFLDMMNDRAKELGCTDTHFNNPHGLTDEEHYTSCYDMALLAREAISNSLFRQIIATKRYNIPPTNKHPDEITYLTNHQKMLWEGEDYYYEYCIGGKTGYTEAAGNTLVTYAEKDGMTLVCVVMKEKPTEQYQDTISLLDYCFENFHTYNIAQELGEEDQIPGLKDDFLTMGTFAELDQEAGVVLPVGADFADAQLQVVYEEENPTIAGRLEYIYGDKVVGSAEIQLIAQEVEQYPFSQTEQQESSETAKKVVQISVGKILLIILGIAVLGALGFGIYKFADNYYLLRYKMNSRGKIPKERILQRKHKRRRR